MKKIFFSIVAVAALAACSKSEVAYESPQEIGFTAVAGNITKSVVSGTDYPTGLNMYVNAFTSDWGNNSTEVSPNYFANIEFINRKDDSDQPTAKWGGATPQYWPNETKLCFSGYSKSGNITPSMASYNPNTDKLTIAGYSPLAGTDPGKNDLMWFPKTTEYSKANPEVLAKMFHTCAWITFMVQGDDVTSVAASNYTIKTITINGIDLTADVTCQGDDLLAQSNLSTYVKWTIDNEPSGTYEVPVVSDGVSLVGTYTPANGSTPASNTPKNVENITDDNPGNIVVIPQTPGSVNITWTYKSPANEEVSDSATGLPLTLGSDQTWEPGKHYVYTITLKASEILITPKPQDWIPGVDGDVTVQ